MKPLFSFFLLLFLFLTNCTIKNTDAIDLENFDFNSNEPAVLYFNNIRKAQYKLSHSPASTKTEIWQLRQQDQMPSIPILQLNILLNIYQANKPQAYIKVLPNTFFEGKTVQVQWQDTMNRTSGTYQLAAKSTMRQHYIFAGQVYKSIKANHLLSVDKAGTAYPLFKNRQGLKPYLQTMRDYYELVGVF